MLFKCLFSSKQSLTCVHFVFCLTILGEQVAHLY